MLIIVEHNPKLSVVVAVGRLSLGLKQFPDVVFDEQGTAEDTHDLDNGPVEFELVLNDTDEAIRDDCDMDLYPHSVLAVSPEGLDTQMLFDPLEEQLDLPSVPVEQGDVLGFEVEVVGVIRERATKVCGVIDDSSDGYRVIVLVPLASESDGLVPQHVVIPLKEVLSINDVISGTELFPDDEECAGLFDGKESGKVEVSPVKDVTSQRLIGEPVHSVDVVYFGRRDPVENGYLRDDIDLGMDFDTRLGAPEFRPSEYREAQVDCRGVNCIESAVQFKLPGDAFALGQCDHVEGEFLKDNIISDRICPGQGLPADRSCSETEKERLVTMRYSYICEFPETAAAEQLSEHEHKHVAPVRKRPPLGSVLVLGQKTAELALGQELGHLSENKFSDMHICGYIERATKVGISKAGHGFQHLYACA